MLCCVVLRCIVLCCVVLCCVVLCCVVVCCVVLCCVLCVVLLCHVYIELLLFCACYVAVSCGQALIYKCPGCGVITGLIKLDCMRCVRLYCVSLGCSIVLYALRCFALHSRVLVL